VWYSSRKTITDANGNYRFGDVETGGFYTVTPSRANYNFNPFHREFQVRPATRQKASLRLSRWVITLTRSTRLEYFVRQQ